jgi:hypothetical protein
LFHSYPTESTEAEPVITFRKTIISRYKNIKYALLESFSIPIPNNKVCAYIKMDLTIPDSAAR